MQATWRARTIHATYRAERPRGLLRIAAHPLAATFQAWCAHRSIFSISYQMEPAWRSDRLRESVSEAAIHSFMPSALSMLSRGASRRSPAMLNTGMLNTGTPIHSALIHSAWIVVVSMGVGKRVQRDIHMLVGCYRSSENDSGMQTRNDRSKSTSRDYA
jgi:hypothetical protein